MGIGKTSFTRTAENLELTCPPGQDSPASGSGLRALLDVQRNRQKAVSTTSLWCQSPYTSFSPTALSRSSPEQPGPPRSPCHEDTAAERPGHTACPRLRHRAIGIIGSNYLAPAKQRGTGRGPFPAPGGGEHPSFGPRNGPTRRDRRLLGTLGAEEGTNVAHLYQGRTGVSEAERPSEAAGRGPAAQKPPPGPGTLRGQAAAVAVPCGARRCAARIVPVQSGVPFLLLILRAPQNLPAGLRERAGDALRAPAAAQPCPDRGNGDRRGTGPAAWCSFLATFLFFSLSLVEIKAHILQPKRLPAERALSEALSSSTPRIPSPSCSAGGFPAGRGVPAASHLPSERETRARAKASRARARSSMLGAMLLVPAAAAL